MELFENVLQTGGIKKNAGFAFLSLDGNILKTELFENNDENDNVKINFWFYYPNVPQAQIQNDWRSVDRKHLMPF